LTFAIKELLLPIFGLALLVHLSEFPTITADQTTKPFIGGFFLGSGIDLPSEVGSGNDGTES